MDRDVPDELLSAYFDDEATPDERREVESWLARSAEARQQVDDLSRVSGLIRSLPTVPAPQELSRAVLQQAERESLLPVPRREPQRRPGRRERIVVCGGLAATLALIVLVLQTVESINSPSESTQTASLERQYQPADRETPLQLEAAAADTEPAGSPVAAAVISAEDLAASLQGRADLPELAEFANGRQLELTETWGARGVRIGEVVQMLDDRIGVIEMTVVDVQQAAGQLRVVLQENSIEADQNEQPLPESSGRSESSIAVYVEAAGDQLARALDEVDHSDLFLDVKLQPPIRPEEMELAESVMDDEPRGSRVAAGDAEIETLAQVLAVRNSEAVVAESARPLVADATAPANVPALAVPAEAAARGGSALARQRSFVVPLDEAELDVVAGRAEAAAVARRGSQPSKLAANQLGRLPDRVRLVILLQQAR